MINEVAINLDQVGMKALTTAIGVLGSRLAVAAMRPHGRLAKDLSIARWFETYQITAKFPELPGISAGTAERLSEVLGGNETQAVLQELLAVRLTDGDDVEAGRVREVFHLTLSSADLSLSPFGPQLAEFYDDRISDMVARLEAAEPSILAQIRSEALSGRMIAILRTIERHTAALTARPSSRSEASFLASYRSHVIDHHGKLEPPDFDRRRRVPIADIYVPATIYENSAQVLAVGSVQHDQSALDAWELAGRLDRTVLLGDPGGGKTTASNVLMHYFASDETRRLPFLVTLRKYAAADPPERSVVGFIEHELETLYQCPAPAGLLDLLLLIGRAVVIFDGLDELLDTSRRADVASRVERFCAEYPLAPVLVTSRVIGYDQARLDETQFVPYRLGGFRDNDVEDYARKWFALEDGTHPDDAETFLAESESVPDLRTNPLLLSLMCILYRGEGSLPRNRAEVYEQCANLLFHRWDARRHIHQDLRAGHLLEPILRHLAWWLFTRNKSQTAVTERELITTTAEFLHGRGFESVTDARKGAQEFVAFSTGRIWVFTDTGTNARGERLFSFTHRTFLEYFAAEHLAYSSDTPEELAVKLTRHVERGEWDVVGELAIQLKDSTSSDGARRIYEWILNELRDDRIVRGNRPRILRFLARSLRSVELPPKVIRCLAQEIMRSLLGGSSLDTRFSAGALAWLLSGCRTTSAAVNEEISSTLTRLIASNRQHAHLNGLRIAVSLGILLNSHGTSDWPDLRHDNQLRKFWFEQAEKNAKTNEKAIVAAAENHTEMRVIALIHNLITADQALAMKGGLTPLMQIQSMHIFELTWSACFDESIPLAVALEDHGQLERLRAIGRYLMHKPKLPWIAGPPAHWALSGWEKPAKDLRIINEFDSIAYLGGVAILLISAEADPQILDRHIAGDTARLWPFTDLSAYLAHRRNDSTKGRLPDLPVPEQFRKMLRDWAEWKINFIAPTPN